MFQDNEELRWLLLGFWGERVNNGVKPMNSKQENKQFTEEVDEKWHGELQKGQQK